MPHIRPYTHHICPYTSCIRPYTHHICPYTFLQETDLIAEGDDAHVAGARPNFLFWLRVGHCISRFNQIVSDPRLCFLHWHALILSILHHPFVKPNLVALGFCPAYIGVVRSVPCLHLTADCHIGFLPVELLTVMKGRGSYRFLTFRAAHSHEGSRVISVSYLSSCSRSF